MTTTLWDYFVVLLIYAGLFGLLFGSLYCLGWAFVGLISGTVRLTLSAIRRLKNPAERELENVRTKKDIAKINICVLNVQESVLKKICQSKSNNRDR